MANLNDLELTTQIQSPDKSLASGILGGTTTPGSTGGTGYSNGVQTVTAGQAGYQTAGYERVDPITRQVDANTETVQGQLRGILDAGSPLMERARAKALEQANSRGLLNSSMAVGAGQAALYDTALQIATPDAATYTQASRDNQGVLNQTAQFNADQFGRNQQFNANAFNQNQQFNVGETNTAGRFNAGAGNELNLTNIREAGATERANAQNATTLQATQMQNENRIAVAQLDAANRVALENIASNNRALIQGSANAGQIYSQMQANIAAIQRDPNLSEEAKRAAIQQEIDAGQAGMVVAGRVANVDFGDTIDWGAARASASANTASGAPAAAPPAAAPPAAGNSGAPPAYTPGYLPGDEYRGS